MPPAPIPRRQLRAPQFGSNMENPERKQEEEMGHGAVSRLPPPLRTPDKQPAAAAPTPARLSAPDPASPPPAGVSPCRTLSYATGLSTSERLGLRKIPSFAILLRKKRIPEGGGVAGGQAGRGDLKPLRGSDWPACRKGAWPLLTMRCEDPTTFQSLRPRPRATPPSSSSGLPVSSATPPSQLLKRTLQSSLFPTLC